MPRSTQALDLAPKKRPAQRRSQTTFEAIVQACTGLLPERGYAGTTTNHIAERAGVNIASLYEYFPGKDAVVAQVADRLVERVLARLAEGAAGLADTPEDEVVRRWIEVIFEIVSSERALVAVFVYQVPYTQALPSMQTLGPRLVEFSQRVRAHAGPFVHPTFSAATLHLVVNLVTSTILQLALDPPADVAPHELLDELAARVESWIRSPA